MLLIYPSCSEDDDCSSGYCGGTVPLGAAVTVNCGGKWHPIAKYGGNCWKDDDDSCYSGQCRGCSKCADSEGRLPDGEHCYKDDDCTRYSYCLDSNEYTVGKSCNKGICTVKALDGQRAKAGHILCMTGNKKCDTCGGWHVVPRGGEWVLMFLSVIHKTVTAEPPSNNAMCLSVAEKTGTVTHTNVMDLALQFVLGPVTASTTIGLRSIQRVILFFWSMRAKRCPLKFRCLTFQIGELKHLQPTKKSDGETFIINLILNLVRLECGLT